MIRKVHREFVCDSCHRLDPVTGVGPDVVLNNSETVVEHAARVQSTDPDPGVQIKNVS
jgi:hypothetical protein